MGGKRQSILGGGEPIERHVGVVPQLGRVYDIGRAARLVRKRPADALYPVPPPADVMTDTIEARRVAKANPDLPGIAVNVGGRVALIDGNHRLMRCALDGRKSFPIHVLTDAEERKCPITHRIGVSA